MLDDINYPAKRSAEFCLEARAFDLDVLNEFEGDVCADSATNNRSDVEALRGVDVFAVAGTVNLKAAQTIAVRALERLLTGTRRKGNHGLEGAALRNLLKHFVGDGGLDLALRHIDCCYRIADVDNGLCANGEFDIQIRKVAGGQVEVSGLGRHTLSFHSERVLAGRQRVQPIESMRIGGRGGGLNQLIAGGRNGSACNDRTGRIGNRTLNCAGGLLRRSGRKQGKRQQQKTEYSRKVAEYIGDCFDH